MVAISLYRGNLHRVPDVPRRWLMPTPKISLKDFRLLLNRRSRTLARLHSTTTTTTSNPNPNPNPNVKQEEEEDSKENNGFPNNDSDPLPSTPPQSDPPKITNPHSDEGVYEDDRKGLDGGDCSVKPIDPDVKPEQVLQSAANPTPEGLENTNAETSNKQDALSDKEKRKKEVAEKLQILNERKHSLVQVLKQILSVEEELKRRSSIQGTGIRPPVPLQVDVTNDSGSMTRLATPRLGSEGNLGTDMEGGEADDVSNHNIQSRHLLRMSSTSPSDSPYRRPAFSTVPHPSRGSLAVAGSPSRFAPTGHQGQPANLPTVSVSGTSYMASSPSPAASGGTSAFRDARLPSPWN